MNYKANYFPEDEKVREFSVSQEAIPATYGRHLGQK
jgi:hypothetical protein